MTIRERIRALLVPELEGAYRLREEAQGERDHAMEINALNAEELARALKHNEILVEVAEHWRTEANRRQKLFSDIVKEVNGAEDLHNLKQIVREMAFRNETYGAILCRPNEPPKVVVTDERVI